jgi:hypothetical protein
VAASSAVDPPALAGVQVAGCRGISECPIHDGTWTSDAWLTVIEPT